MSGGPFRAEFGAIHHEDDAGFLFTVTPPHAAGEVAKALNAAAFISTPRASEWPPTHWKDADQHERHPKTAREWNWREDPPLGEGGLEVAIRRLNFAGDLADPRAPDQMALVLRKDLINVKHELLRQTALADALRQNVGDAERAMVKARREAEEAQSTADLWRRFVAEGGLGNGLLLRLWRMIVAYRAAVTPSAATKFVHIGEYHLEIQGPPDPEIELEEGEEGEPTTIRVPVPWDTVKTIMSAIRADAERDINR